MARSVYIMNLSNIHSITTTKSITLPTTIIDFRILSPFVYVLTETSLHEYSLDLNRVVHTVNNNDFVGKKMEIIEDKMIVVYAPHPQIYTHFWTYNIASSFPHSGAACP